MIALLAGNPVLLLFVVAGLGFLLGRLKVFGFGLGVAAVLFVGLGAGALDHRLALPEFVYLFGLALFVYTMGLGSGPGFFRSMRRQGLRDNGLVVGLLAADAALVAIAARALSLRGPQAAGLFAGALTNTPALAGVLDTLKARAPAATETALAEPVVAYSLTYPAGVLGVLAATYVFCRASGPGPGVSPSRRPASPEPGALEAATVLVTEPRALGQSPAALRSGLDLHVSFGRVRRDGVDAVLVDDAPFRAGDLVSVVGAPADLEKAVAALGRRAAESLALERETIDFRRMFVSNPAVTERPLRSLELGTRFGAVITRVRRGDVDLVAEEGTTLELGDRVRVVAPRAALRAVGAYLGDSYKALSEIDVIAFSLGIALGLLLGEVPIPMPGGVTLKLGFAGGPLVVGLVLGRLGRTGPVVWTLPFSANLTLRQIGLVMFLAGVGTRSGHAFAGTGGSANALLLVAMGACATATLCGSVYWLGHRLGVARDVLCGMVAGAHTQPAALAFAVEQTGTERPNVGYATVYPAATIAKVVLAQLVLVFVR